MKLWKLAILEMFRVNLKKENLEKQLHEKKIMTFKNKITS